MASSEDSSGSAHQSPNAPATRAQVQRLEAAMEVQQQQLQAAMQVQQQQLQVQQQQLQVQQQQLLAALAASEARMLQEVRQMQPCRCPSDTAQRLEAVEERLQHMHMADAPRASAHGSVNQQPPAD